MEWISVKERMPPENTFEELLVLTKNKRMFVAMITFPLGRKRRKFIEGNDRGGWVEIKGVTHWMPLPDVPKE